MAASCAAVAAAAALACMVVLVVVGAVAVVVVVVDALACALVVVDGLAGAAVGVPPGASGSTDGAHQLAVTVARCVVRVVRCSVRWPTETTDPFLDNGGGKSVHDPFRKGVIAVDAKRSV